MYHPALLGPNHCVFQPSHLDRACLSALAALYALPFSLLGTELFDSSLLLLSMLLLSALLLHVLRVGMLLLKYSLFISVT